MDLEFMYMRMWGRVVLFYAVGTRGKEYPGQLSVGPVGGKYRQQLVIQFGQTQQIKYEKFTGENIQKDVRCPTCDYRAHLRQHRVDSPRLSNYAFRQEEGAYRRFFVLIAFNVGGVVKLLYLYESFEALASLSLHYCVKEPPTAYKSMCTELKAKPPQPLFEASAARSSCSSQN